jgi:hypothetical protein
VPRFRIEELPRPGRQLAIRIAVIRRDELEQIRKLLFVVAEGVEVGGVLRRQRKFFRGLVLDGRRESEDQDVGPLVESRDRDAVAEHVVNPAQRHRLRLDPEIAGQHAQIVPVARPQHDPVLAERDGGRIAVYGLVVDRQARHR